VPAYIDRVLEATNPANLPVQLPTKFETLANLKSALRRALPRSPKNVRPTGWPEKSNIRAIGTGVLADRAFCFTRSNSAQSAEGKF